MVVVVVVGVGVVASSSGSGRLRELRERTEIQRCVKDGCVHPNVCSAFVS